MEEISIDDDLYEVLKVRAEEKDFDSTEKYVHHLLEQVVQKIKNEKQDTSYTDEQEEAVKDKLKDLGYIG